MVDCQWSIVNDWLPLTIDNRPLYKIIRVRNVWILTALFIAGCARINSTTSTAPTPSGYVQQIAPFPVEDATGTPYDHPFLGGLNVPRPQFVDIDADGDADLFIQEFSESVLFFENTSTPERTAWTWRSNQYRDLNIGEWYRFVDLDADGDVDLLTERKYSHIQYYRNDGTPQQAAFTLAVDTLRDVSGEPVFADRQNIPNVADIDCDGLPDLFIGRVTGTVMRYESVGMDDQHVPRFELVTERFEDIEIIGQVMGGTGGTLHGANTMTFRDYDADGDVDLFWGDFFEPGLLLIENSGTCTTPDLRTPPTPFPLDNPVETSGYNAPAFFDQDLDGDLDLIIGVLGGAFNPNRTSIGNLLLFEQTAPETYIQRTDRFLTQIDIGSESIPTFGDLDGDGDLDLLLANKIDPNEAESARIYHFANTGSATKPHFREMGNLAVEPSYHYAPALGDLDADGDLDMIMGTWNAGLALYRNTGTATVPNFVAENLEYIRLTRGSNSIPALGDLDADGDLDLMIGETSGTLNYYQNIGTPQIPEFQLVSDKYLDADVGRRSAPTFHDLDGDEDLDMIVGTSKGELHHFENTGTAQAPSFADPVLLDVPLQEYAIPVFTDLDQDGDADLILGGIGGGLRYFERR